MGLVEFVARHSLDEGYQLAARTRPTVAGKPVAKKMGLRGAVIVAIFALLITTAAVQTTRGRDAAEQGRSELVAQLQDRQADLAAARAELADLRAMVERLRGQVGGGTQAQQQLFENRDRLAAATGAFPVRGRGVELTVDDLEGGAAGSDRVLDADLRGIVNGLWGAGAEAIAINGQRLTSLSAIRHAGSAITVNFVSLSPPYRIQALGPAESLMGRFAQTSSGQAWLAVQRQLGLPFSYTQRETMRLPGVGVPPLRHIELKGQKEL